MCKSNETITDTWPYADHDPWNGCRRAITFRMSNIKPVSCGKTALEFEFKDEVLVVEGFLSLKLDFTYRHIYLIFSMSWNKHGIGSIGSLLGSLNFWRLCWSFGLLLNVTSCSEPQERGRYFGVNRTGSLKKMCLQNQTWRHVLAINETLDN